jgi:hypothetical protein
MRDLIQNKNQNQTQSEEELHDKDQEVKHLQGEEQEKETQRTLTSCPNMQIQVETGMFQVKRNLMLIIITRMQLLFHQMHHRIREMQVSSSQMLVSYNLMQDSSHQT